MDSNKVRSDDIKLYAPEESHWCDGLARYHQAWNLQRNYKLEANDKFIFFIFKKSLKKS
jgi:hypothetical protein